jgi:large subunit ribosomal protein L27
MSSVLSLASRLAVQRTSVPFQQQVRTATKKAGGSSSNGRDSAGRRLGIKIFPGLEAKAGSIIIRQRGNKFRVGENVGVGRDHTIFALKPGIVQFTRLDSNKKRNVVHVLDK